MVALVKVYFYHSSTLVFLKKENKRQLLGAEILSSGVCLPKRLQQLTTQSESSFACLFYPLSLTLYLPCPLQWEVGKTKPDSFRLHANGTVVSRGVAFPPLREEHAQTQRVTVVPKGDSVSFPHFGLSPSVSPTLIRGTSGD